MKGYRNIVFFIFMCTVSLCAGCMAAELDFEISYEVLNGIAADNHRSYHENNTDDTVQSICALMYDGFDEEKDIAVAQKYENYLVSGQLQDGESAFTKEAVLADIDFLFDFLPYGYAGYGMFGGDKVFMEIKAGIEGAFENSVDGVFSRGDIRTALEGPLYQVIQDNHFTFSSRENLRPDTYWADTIDFSKDAHGYYVTDRVDENKNYAQSVKISKAAISPALEDVMKLVFNDDGELVYRIVCLYEEAGLSQAIVTFEDGGVLSVFLTPLNEKNEKEEEFRDINVHNVPWRKETINDIPVLICYSFKNAYDTELTAFESTGSEFAQTPYLIIDIRNNSGGDATYALNWTTNFVGKQYENIITERGYSLTLMTKTFEVSATKAVASSWERYFNMKREKGQFPGWDLKEPENTFNNPIPNDTKVFVLMDETSTSATEYFVMYLSLIDNVIFVGDRTGGLYNFTLNRSVYLPNTGIELYCGLNLNITENLQFIDNIGFQPDIICPSDLALDLVARYIASLEDDVEAYGNKDYELLQIKGWDKMNYI